MKSLFQYLKDLLKCKATTPCEKEEKISQPNQMPHNVQKYGMDYVNVYDVINDLSKLSAEYKKLKEQSDRDHLFFQMKLDQAISALKEIRSLGSLGELSPEAQIADEALKKIMIQEAPDK